MNVMRRSSMGWRGRLTDSKSSSRVGPRAAESTAPLLTAAPDRRRRLSEGTLIEASVVARLLGIKLLKLHATVMMMPADVEARPAAPPDPAALEPAPASLPPARLYPTGRGLVEASRHINVAEELLAEARHNGANPAT